MNDEIVLAAIEQFARNADATIRRASDTVFEVAFADEEYPAYITVETGLGVFVNYAIMCGVVPDTSFAPALLQKNCGGVVGTCFYFSVRVHETKPWLFLEAKQWFDDDTTAEDMASTLGLWRLTSRQAKDEVLGQSNTSVKHAEPEGGSGKARPASCALCGRRVQTTDVPLDVLMVITEGLAPVICKACVTNRRIPVEHMEVQDRIRYDGQKYLSYGDIFVQV